MKNWDYLGAFDNGYAEVAIREGTMRKYGLIDRTGKVVIPPVYSTVVKDGNHDFVRVNQGVKFGLKQYYPGKWGVVNLNNKIIVPIKYTTIHPFVNGLAPAKYRSRWGVIDLAGNTVVPFKYAELGPCNPLLRVMPACSHVALKWGVVDCAENEIIPFMYDDLFLPLDTDFDWLPVRLASERFFIDWQNKRVLF